MNELVITLLKTAGLGLLTGFVFGFLFKKITKIVLFLVALLVVLVVVLGHNEILQIDWLSSKDQFQAFFDNHFEHYSERMRMFMQNTPFSVGLIIGGLVGLKNG